MNPKLARKLRKKANYNPSKDSIRNRQYSNELSGQKCLGSRRYYRELKKEAKRRQS